MYFRMKSQILKILDFPVKKLVDVGIGKSLNGLEQISVLKWGQRYGGLLKNHDVLEDVLERALSNLNTSHIIDSNPKSAHFLYFTQKVHETLIPSLPPLAPTVATAAAAPSPSVTALHSTAAPPPLQRQSNSPHHQNKPKSSFLNPNPNPRAQPPTAHPFACIPASTTSSQATPPPTTHTSIYILPCLAMEPVFEKKKKRKRRNPDTSPSLPIGTSSSLPVGIRPAADSSSSLPVDTHTSSSLPLGIDASSSFPIELLCSYTSDRIEECAMPRRDGSCSMSNTQRASLNKDVTFLFFENFDRLSDLLHCLNDLDHPNIPKVRAAIDEPEPTLVVDRIASVPVKKWLHEAGRWEMWTVDSTGSQYTELEEKHKKVFRCISKTLAYLHTRQRCHGNLLEGIWVTEPTENDVCVSLANFDTSIGNLSNPTPVKASRLKN
ncbi:uncharacterized protein LOC131316205 [Rhododendron vialii]|uniref:uncharacterized protein LOC131316205 n=1 Tax=Rhododendron vialii TaxID=182163 RepID=UPI00265E2DDE|nr:uncharacterized protein LOC131316205 [Rhododendron vialii]